MFEVQTKAVYGCPAWTYVRTELLFPWLRFFLSPEGGFDLYIQVRPVSGRLAVLSQQKLGASQALKCRCVLTSVESCAFLVSALMVPGLGP